MKRKRTKVVVNQVFARKKLQDMSVCTYNAHQNPEARRLMPALQRRPHPDRSVLFRLPGPGSLTFHGYQCPSLSNLSFFLGYFYIPARKTSPPWYPAHPNGCYGAQLLFNGVAQTHREEWVVRPCTGIDTTGTVVKKLTERRQ